MTSNAMQPTQHTSDTNTRDIKPWHRQFWPWFLIALPGSVIIACVITAVIALRHDDSRVVVNYYKEGLAINQRLNADRTAQQLGLQAQLQIDADGHVMLRLDGAQQLNAEQTAPARLQLQLIHPLDNQRDQTLLLEHVGADEYVGQLATVPDGRWHLQLDDPADPRWRLRTDTQFDAGSTSNKLTMRADAAPTNR